MLVVIACKGLGQLQYIIGTHHAQTSKARVNKMRYEENSRQTDRVYLLTMVMMMMMMKRFETRIECVCGLAGRYCRCVAPPVPWEGEVVVDGWVGVDGRMDVDVTVQMKKFRKPPFRDSYRGRRGRVLQRRLSAIEPGGLEGGGVGSGLLKMGIEGGFSDVLVSKNSRNFAQWDYPQLGCVSI